MSRAPDPKPFRCRHCGRGFCVRIGRGLCRRCWNDRAIRAQYPVVAEFGGIRACRHKLMLRQQAEQPDPWRRVPYKRRARVAKVLRKILELRGES